MTTLRPLSIDDLSAARYIHSASFMASAEGHYSKADIEAVTAFVRSPLYADLMLGNNAAGAWIEQEMVGVAAWSPGETRSLTARLIMVAVRPLFTGAGIGRLLVDHVQSAAREAGFPALEVSATLNSVRFFEDLGFRVVRGGEWALPLGHEISVVFMRKAEFTGLHAIS